MRQLLHYFLCQTIFNYYAIQTNLKLTTASYAAG
jgi:hypothetical protein